MGAHHGRSVRNASICFRSSRESEGIQVYVATLGDRIAPLPDRPFIQEVATELKRQLGPDTQVTLNRGGVSGVWVSFDIDSDVYWVYMPRSRIERNEPLRWIGWGLLVLVLAGSGAYFIVSLINRPLRELTRATAQMARGATPQPVTETGPSEITSLARAFNHLADDLKRLDDERVLLLAGVSHDLRTPLSRIRLGIEMLDDKGDTELRTGLVQDIEEIDVAIGQFLDFARLRDAEAAVADSDLNAAGGERGRTLSASRQESDVRAQPGRTHGAASPCDATPARQPHR